MAPTSAFEKPSIRVYSSPKPTQPDSSTIGEFSFRPQNSTASRRVVLLGVEESSVMRGSGCGRIIRERRCELHSARAAPRTELRRRRSPAL